MLHMFPKAKGIICIEDNKPDCIAKFRELVLPEDNIEVLELKTKYPQGAERMLIYAATGRKVIPPCCRRTRAVSWTTSTP